MQAARGDVAAMEESAQEMVAPVVPGDVVPEAQAGAAARAVVKERGPVVPVRVSAAAQAEEVVVVAEEVTAAGAVVVEASGP